MTIALISNTNLDNRQYTTDDYRADCFAIGAYWTVNNLFADLQKNNIPFDVYAHFNFLKKTQSIQEIRKRIVGELRPAQTWANDFNEIEQIFLERHGIDISKENHKLPHWQFYRVIMQFYWFIDTSYKAIQQNDIYTHFLRWRPDSIWKKDDFSSHKLKAFLYGGFKINTGYEITQAMARVQNISLVPGVSGNQIMVADQFFCLEREAVIKCHEVLHQWVTYTYQQLTSMDLSDPKNFGKAVLRDFVYPEVFLGKLLTIAKIHVSVFDTFCQRLVRPTWLENSTVEEINSFANANIAELNKFLNSIEKNKK